MSTHTHGPWKLLEDEYSGELHYMVVDSLGATLFDSVNRSPAAPKSTERADLMLAAAATELLAIAQAAVVNLPEGHQKQAWLSVIAKATGGAA